MECRSTHQPTYKLTLNQYSCQPTLPPRVILVNILSHISTDTQPRVDGVWSTSKLICQPMPCQEVPKLQRRSNLGSTSDWLKEISFAARPIKSTIEFVIFLQMLYCRESSGGVTKCWLFSQAATNS